MTREEEYANADVSLPEDRVRFEDWNDEIWNDDVHQTNERCDSRGNATLGRLMMRWSRPERETPCLASHLFGEENVDNNKTTLVVVVATRATENTTERARA